MIAPILIFGWGNPSRGDDALAPLLLHRLERDEAHPAVELLTDFQLMPEHALDLEGRRCVLFVDASADPGDRPFRVRSLSSGGDASFTSHALSPGAVMQVFQTLRGVSAPPCLLLAIAGQSFDLGQPLSPMARDHLEQATHWVRHWLRGQLAFDAKGDGIMTDRDRLWAERNPWIRLMCFFGKDKVWNSDDARADFEGLDLSAGLKAEIAAWRHCLDGVPVITSQHVTDYSSRALDLAHRIKREQPGWRVLYVDRSWSGADIRSKDYFELEIQITPAQAAAYPPN